MEEPLRHTLAETDGNHAGARWPASAFLALLVGFAAISRQSFWIDEALTAAKASAHGLQAWWQAMLADKASDLQMPCYMIYIWGVAKILGTSEWALRAANIPWYVAGVAVFTAAMPAPKKTALALVTLACPFAWYYLDEARPYAMQLGASLMIFGAIHGLSDAADAGRSRDWIRVFCLGLILLAGSSLLGMIWAGAACVCLPLLFSWQRLAEFARSQRAAGWLTPAILAALAGYYLWTLKLGARASDVGQTGARNVIFIAYELLGFGGLGPGRLEIRDGGLGAFAPFAAQLALYAIVVISVLVFGVRQIYQSQCRKTLLALSLALAAPAVVILGAGFFQHFRVLGRHFTPLLPVVLFVFGLGFKASWSRRHGAGRLAACAFILLSVASCLSFRFAARHKKDDYRDAAMLANGALRSGHAVWWNAGREGAVYYQVPLMDAPPAGRTGQNGRAVWLMNPAPEILAALPAPDIIVTSKPDVYDGGGAMADYLREHGYFKQATLPAFAIWRRSGMARSPGNSFKAASDLRAAGDLAYAGCGSCPGRRLGYKAASL